ncbi:hypothetical protein Glove_300g91 [Diversispora epigaea]|uniref:TLDc domain-containing protein n=1 Tax=Diversispora epigaea TaxID=1348612 RepID=A0A397HX76_9GLOM|nr:hypothetical protein Glove_300g91 [Diversispora epigaea]
MDTKLMVNADELELKELSEKLESYLIESKASWLRTHFSLIYHLIFDSNEFKGLKKFYNEIITKYPNLIFESEDFTSLQETALISILQRDDLKVEEIKIWDYVIKWGIAQSPTLPTNSEECQDGFRPKTFWKICNGHTGTIVVAKVAGTDEIVGGYNPLACDNSIGDHYIETNDSFIFSLKNGNIQDSILSRVIDYFHALLYHDSNDQNTFGPLFGNCKFVMKSEASDFTQDKLCSCECDSENYLTCYEKPIRTTNETFSIVDYEVFKII